MDTPSEAGVVDELGDAVVDLLRTWRAISRRGTDSPLGAAAVPETVRLLGAGEHRLSRIAELRGVDQSVASRQVTEPARRGLGCRRPDPSDHRASLIRLSPDGHEVLAKSRVLRQEWLRGALARYPVADIRATAELVAALAAELDARAADVAPLVAPAG